MTAVEHPPLLPAAIALAIVAVVLQGCTNMMPQYAAQQYAPSYYESGYNTLSPQQKFQLENHLSNQSNQAWQTTAQVMRGAGSLLGGTGSLLGAINSIDHASAHSHPRSLNLRIPRNVAQR
jgi:hypothetical protein